MDMSAFPEPDRRQAGVRNPRPRTRAELALAFATAARSSAAAAKVGSPLLLGKLILPTLQNVQQLASALGQKLAARLSAAGLPKTPAISMSVDDTGGVRVCGDRADLAAIELAVSADAGLQRLIRATSAIASQVDEIENGGRLEFQRAYRLSSDTQEIVAQYANPSRGTSFAATTAIVFSGGAVSVVTEGRTGGGS
jgi:hypothetical protein